MTYIQVKIAVAMDTSSEQNKAEKNYALVAKDASSFALRISWLKNEPRSRFFLSSFSALFMYLR